MASPSPTPVGVLSQNTFRQPASILSANVHRRHLSKGQQTLAQILLNKISMVAVLLKCKSTLQFGYGDGPGITG